VLLEAGTVQCWGNNSYGQIGSEDVSESATPIDVPGLSEVTSIGVGYYHSCAVLVGGAVKCWGYNYNGQLGNDTTSDLDPNPVPVDVVGLDNAVAIVGGWVHTCALISDGTVRCWGGNDYGQIGDNSIAERHVPTVVIDINTAEAIAGAGYHTCVVLSGGGISCWGLNSQGQLGTGSTQNGYLPQAVTDMSDAVAVAAGTHHSCAVRSDGSVACWGSNNTGQLGDGSTETRRELPSAVSGVTTASSVVAGSQHTCALLGDSSVWCWGDNIEGQLGIGTTSLESRVPVATMGL
jgi:alpha-tubulin suppressor-like RCC1 family protein